MDGYPRVTRIGLLFAEDFDMSPAAHEPEIAEPVFSDADMSAAREAAWHEGHAAGLRQAADSQSAAISQAVSAIAEQLTANRDVALAMAEESAGAIARLLMESLATMFPVLSARHGDAEIRAVVHAVLPALMQEPAITVRVNPCAAVGVEQEIALHPGLAARIRIDDCNKIAPGDVRIVWSNGSAARDTAALWRDVAAVLAPAGLLGADTALKETVDDG